MIRNPRVAGQSKNPIASEYEDSVAFVQWCKLQPKIKDLIFHIPNEGKRSFSLATRLKRLGLRAGVSDYFIPYPTKSHHGLWIEFKRKDYGKATIDQLNWCALMLKMGYDAHIAFGLDDAIEIVLEYLA